MACRHSGRCRGVHDACTLPTAERPLRLAEFDDLFSAALRRADPALAFAVERAATLGVPLQVIRAWHPVTGLWVGTPMVTRTVTPEERQPFGELVAGWRDKHPALEITVEAVVEHPAAALALPAPPLSCWWSAPTAVAPYGAHCSVR